MEKQQQATGSDAESTDAEIGRRVHHLMWDRKLSQKEFGLRLGMDQTTVSKKLRGNVGWSTSQLVRAAETLDVTVGYLFGESGGPTLDPNRPPTDYSTDLPRPIVQLFGHREVALAPVAS